MSVSDLMAAAWSVPVIGVLLPLVAAAPRATGAAAPQAASPLAPETLERQLDEEWRRQRQDLEQQIRALTGPSARPNGVPTAPPQTPADLLHESEVELGSWYVVGPFGNESGRGPERALPPEESFDSAAVYRGLKGLVTWQNARWAAQDGRNFALAPFVGDLKEPFTAYMRRTVESRRAGVLRGSIRTSAAVAVWLNGAKVLAKPAPAGRHPGQEGLRLELKAGRNALLIKSSQGAGGWRFAFDFDWPGAPHRSRAPSPAELRERARPFRPDAAVAPGDRDAADVVLRRTAAMLADLAGHLEPARAADFAARLDRLKTRSEQAGPANGELRAGLYRDACRLRRAIALSNPLLDFAALLFIKRHPSRGNHMCFQYYGRNAVPGGGLYVLADPFGHSPKLRNVLSGALVAGGRLKGQSLQGGCLLSPELSYDGRTILFAHTECMGTDWGPESCFHIFRVGIDGRGLTQITDGPWNDLHPCFLPDGRICFISERRGGFGRCFAPHTPTYTLHAMNADGGDIKALSWHETNEWHPSVNHDGMIVYTRWDYVDRDTNVAHHPWTTSPDGRDARAMHGNFPVAPYGRQARPWMEMNVRAIPGSRRYVATAAPHHGQAFGSLVVVDPDVEDDDLATPVRRLTPDVPFPEAEGPRDLRSPWSYATAWPLSEDYYLCAYSPSRDAPAGIYLLDSFGNRELIYRDDEIGCRSPIPVRARRPPPVLTAPATAADAPRADGTVACVNVYDSLSPWPSGTKIASLRIVEVFAKSTAWADSPKISMGRQASARGVLGTVPVESDGSAHFTIPPGRPVYFQALDERGLAVQSMRSVTYVQPGQRLVCQGCHERRQSAPAPPKSAPLAMRRPPSAIAPEVDGAYPVCYPRLVQPVLDRRCVACHSRQASAPNLSAEVVDETGRPADEGWSRSYRQLAPRGFWFHSIIGRFVDPLHGGSRSTPGEFGARASLLFRMLDAGHNGLKLPPEDMHRIALWLDTNCVFYGAYHHASRQERGERVLPILERYCPPSGQPRPPPAVQPASTRPATGFRTVELKLAPGVTMALVALPKGSFMLGTNHQEPLFRTNEAGRREATVEAPFCIGVQEVTQEQYHAVCGRNPSRFQATGRPVENVSWDEAVDFCRRASARTGLTVRLPTEVEWEYACRAGTTSRFSFGDDEAALPAFAWYGAAAGGPQPAGRKAPNPWGLFDVHGNVMEWCSNEYIGSHAAVAAPPGARPATTTYRVVRGGSWFDQPSECRSACRRGIVPTYRSSLLGFRVVSEPAALRSQAAATTRSGTYRAENGARNTEP